MIISNIVHNYKDSKGTNQLINELSSLIYRKEGTLIFLDFYQLNNLPGDLGIDCKTKFIEGITNDIICSFGNEVLVFKLNTSQFALLNKSIIPEDKIISQIGILRERLSRFSTKFNLGYNVAFFTGVIYTHQLKSLSYPLDLIDKGVELLSFSSLMKSNNIIFYDASIDLQIRKAKYIDQEILNGLFNKEFYVVYQPIYDLVSNSLWGFEALLRWKSKEFESISPEEFIPVAEANNSIIQLGKFVLEEICQFINKYYHDKGKKINVSINTSIVEMYSHDFSTNVIKKLNEYDIESKYLTIEITETYDFDNNEILCNHITHLHSFGVKTAMDDFGTGYASVRNLLEKIYKKIKIDKSILYKSINNPVYLKFMSSIVDLCRESNLKVVVEGIESQEMLNIVKKVGADYGQGYYLSRPLSVDDLFTKNIK